MRINRWSVPLLCGGLLAALPAIGVAQGTGTIVGRVTDRATQQPIPEVQIVVAGTTRGTRADAQGDFRLTEVPAGPVQLRALRLGYQSQTQPVSVVAGATATANFELVVTARTLDEVTITATGEQQRKRESGANIGTIKPPEAPAAKNNMAGVLQGQVAGVTVQQSGGTTGTGARVRIRGANSVSLSNEPLLVVDGVRVNNGANSFSIGVGGQSVSRLNDINPNDIENIEVLKGPAATGLFGTAAANGVIQITTRKGRDGKARWTVYTEQGAVEDRTDYPDNFNTYTTNPTTGVSNLGFCFLADGSDCPIDSLARYNPLKADSPFRVGHRQRYGANVSGGSQQINYFISGDLEEEEGIYDISNLDRINLRTNLSAELNSRLNVGISASYLTSDLRLPINDNSNLGIVSNGLLGRARAQETPTDTRRGYFNRPPDTLMVIETLQGIERFLGSANGNWSPLDWLSVVGTVGYDALTRHDNELFPPNRITNNLSNREGSRTTNRLQIFNYTANAAATARFNLTPDLLSTSTIGAQFLREDFEGTFAFGAILVEGGTTIDATVARFAVGEDNDDNRTLGLVASQQFAFRDRLFVNLGVRGDDNSAFGKDFGVIYYPSASLSWVVSEEGFFPSLRALSSLRLRAAFGESGLRPGNLDAIRFFAATPVTVAAADVAGFTLSAVGNPALKPERTREYEGGFDLELFSGRVNLEATAFRKRSEDALVNVVFPPSAGSGGGRFENIGSVENKGFEGLLNATVVDLDNVRFDATINYTHVKNELTELNRDPIIFGLGGDTQRHTEGRPLGAYYQTPYTFDDANGDGIIGYDEVTVGDSAEYLGNPLPTRTISFTGNLTFFKYFRLSALIDHQGGYKQFNSTEEFRCSAILNCQALYDPNASLFDQARAIAGFQFGTAAGYIEDGTFTRLRELSLTISAPERYARRMGARGLTFTLAGRNLALWTDYTGFDPELNFAGQSNFSQADFLTQPPARYLTARLDVNF